MVGCQQHCLLLTAQGDPLPIVLHDCSPNYSPPLPISPIVSELPQLCRLSVNYPCNWDQDSLPSVAPISNLLNGNVTQAMYLQKFTDTETYSSNCLAKQYDMLLKKHIYKFSGNRVITLNKRQQPYYQKCQKPR